MKDMFWPGVLCCVVLLAIFDADFSSPSPSTTPGCRAGVIRVHAPYDIRQALAQAEVLAGRVVVFEQAESRESADITISDTRLAHRGHSPVGVGASDASRDPTQRGHRGY